MTFTAIIMFIIAASIIWGGLTVSVVALIRKPEVSHYPAGGEDLPGEDLDD